MKISITKPLRPYSHTPGMQCLIPGTHSVIEAFPTFLRIDSLEIPLENTSSLRSFTLQQDLERNCVWVFGDRFRAKIFARPDGIEMIFRRGSVKETKFFPMELSYFVPENWERLSLGSHKAQDWGLVQRRFDLKEILPLLFGLGQKSPLQERNLPVMDMEELCRLEFHHMLVPRKEALQRQFYRMIRALFLREEESCLQILPACSFDAGRMINLQTKWGVIDIEWTKRHLQRMIFRANITGTVLFDLPRGIRSFRAKTIGHGRGSTFSVAEPFSLESGKVYFIDRFWAK